MAKVMLAEDDPTMVALLKTLLNMEGFEIAILADGENVIDALNRELPDVVLMDVHLAQGNGIDFLKAIRAEHALAKTVVIMSSGMNVADECIAAGADRFLMKPYMPDDLIKDIRESLLARSN